MTIDDENSIYVGGLPYSATEDSVRRVFSLYGSIVAVKIINDRGMRGKCYCFVTFRNPRSVADAINDMNGKTMDGRILRVNGVTGRGGRSNFDRDRFQHNVDRGMDRGNRLDRGRKRDRDYDDGRDRFRERFNNRFKEADASREYYGVKERLHEHVLDHDIQKDGVSESEGRDLADNEPEHQDNDDFDQERVCNIDLLQETETGRTNESPKIFEGTDQGSRKWNSSTYNEQCDRDMSSETGDDYNNEVNERVKKFVHRRDELRKEISQIEESLGDQNISELQKKHQKLEEALGSARKLTADRRRQLTKLYKCFLQVKTHAEIIKSSEQELQSLVDAAAIENDAGDDLA